MIRHLFANGVTPVDNHLQLNDALRRACNITETGVDTVQCNSDTTHAEDKLRPECPHKVTMNDYACRADALI